MKGVFQSVLRDLAGLSTHSFLSLWMSVWCGTVEHIFENFHPSSSSTRRGRNLRVIPVKSTSNSYQEWRGRWWAVDRPLLRGDSKKWESESLWGDGRRTVAQEEQRQTYLPVDLRRKGVIKKMRCYVYVKISSRYVKMSECWHYWFSVFQWSVFGSTATVARVRVRGAHIYTCIVHCRCFRCATASQ